jgi:putative endonuclease
VSDTRNRGAHWESVAARFLSERGLKPLSRNYHGRFGEIDLVMLDNEALVFIEVRFRRRSAYGSGADSVTRTKQARIVRAAGRFLQENPRQRRRPCRFDVVSIGIDGEEPVIDWIRGAFEA